MAVFPLITAVGNLRSFQATAYVNPGCDFRVAAALRVEADEMTGLPTMIAGTDPTAAVTVSRPVRLQRAV